MPPAAAATAGGTGQFGITPAPGRGGVSPPYFMMTLAAGQSAIETAIITNQGRTATS